MNVRDFDSVIDSKVATPIMSTRNALNATQNVRKVSNAFNFITHEEPEKKRTNAMMKTIDGDGRARSQLHKLLAPFSTPMPAAGWRRNQASIGQ